MKAKLKLLTPVALLCILCSMSSALLAAGGHDSKNWQSLGEKNIQGFKFVAIRFVGSKPATIDPETQELTTPKDTLEFFEIEITPADGKNITAVRGWLGDEKSDALKQKLDGHSHGGTAVGYKFVTEVTKDDKQFTVQVDVEGGKAINATFPTAD